MKRNLLSFAALFFLSAGCATVTFFLIKNSMKKVLDDIVKMSSTTSFFITVLFLTLFFSAMSSVLGVSFDLKPESAKMEYIWKIGSGLSSVLSGQLLISLAFILLITIIIVVLKRTNHE